MGRYILRRLAGLPPVLLAVSFIVFAAVRLLPGDPARIMAGPEATAEDVAGVRARLGFDQPFATQYGRYLLGIAHGDFGTSVRSKAPVWDEVAARVPYTASLALAAYGVALLVGLAAGTVAGIRRNGWPDRMVMVGAVLGAATANFWLALMAMSLFAVQLRWLPLLGAAGWRNYVMPTLTLAVGPTALVARMTRSSLIEALAQDHVRTARAKGLGELGVKLRHGLRNALLPVVTTIGLNFGGLLGGAVVTESVFNWPGLGRLLVDSVRFRDYPVIQAVTLLSVCSVVLVNLAADCVLAKLDPRIRLD
jgi:glutathione transport system permease protein